MWIRLYRYILPKLPFIKVTNASTKQNPIISQSLSFWLSILHAFDKLSDSIDLETLYLWPFLPRASLGGPLSSFITKYWSSSVPSPLTIFSHITLTPYMSPPVPSFTRYPYAADSSCFSAPCSHSRTPDSYTYLSTDLSAWIYLIRLSKITCSTQPKNFLIFYITLRTTISPNGSE